NHHLSPPSIPLSLHDALPISGTLPPIYLFQIVSSVPSNSSIPQPCSLESFNNDNELTSTSTCLVFSEPIMVSTLPVPIHVTLVRSEEHTSELQSRENLVCSLL